MKRDRFILITCLLAGINSLLYIAKIILEEYDIASLCIAIGNGLYIPGTLIFRKKYFVYWSMFYALVLVFLIAFFDFTLFNNYTALFPLFVAMLLKPSYKILMCIIYLVAVTIGFVLTDESVLCFIIHIARSAWIIYILDYFIKTKFVRKQLVLTDDEVIILEELREKKLLKACTSFSKNTLTQKLKEARDRNKIDNNAELLAEYNIMLKK